MSLYSRKVRAGGLAALVVVLMAAPSALAQGSINGPPLPPPPPVPRGGGFGTVNTAPVISSITAVQVAGQKFHIYGKVTDDTPGSCGVVVSGAASGVVLCDASGNFDGVFDVTTPGAATAVAGDGQLQSAPVNLNLGNAAPTISMTITHGANGVLTISGHVGDEVPAGLVVTFTGNNGISGSAIVLADGSWSSTATVPDGATGTVTANVSDWYGLTGTATATY
jgi:hypothetical protein